MQSEPSTTTPTTITESHTHETTEPREHGLHPHEPAAVALSPAHDNGAEAGTTTTADEQLALDAAFARSLAEQPHTSGRLSPPGTPSPPVLNRISEYEKASTPPVRKKEGPVFEVIKKQRSPGDKRSPIQELPNGGF